MLSPKAFETRDAYDDVLLATLKEAEIDLIVLAGFMTILSGRVIRAYENRILNVHPALIPSFLRRRFLRTARSSGSARARR